MKAHTKASEELEVNYCDKQCFGRVLYKAPNNLVFQSVQAVQLFVPANS